MLKLLFLLLCLISFTNRITAQTIDTAKKEKVFMFVEQMPAFPGGSDSMFAFIKRNLRYPAIAKENGIEGTVLAQFVIDRVGNVNSVKIVRGIGGGCDDEVLRIINSFPKCVPGKHAGEAVSVQFILPIKFKLEDTRKKK